MIRFYHNADTDTSAYMTLDANGVLTITGGSTAQGNRIMISLSPTTGLGIYINGSGYSGLGFVSDGNGHMVLGK